MDDLVLASQFYQSKTERSVTKLPLTSLARVWECYARVYSVASNGRIHPCAFRGLDDHVEARGFLDGFI